MEKFTVLEGVAAPLTMINVDTDMIIPKQYLKTIKRTGLGKSLFAEKRYRDDGSENPDFVLNKPAYRGGEDTGRGREFRLRLLARACALGAPGFRHPLRDRAVFRRHFLQQLLQERHAADQGAPEDSGQAVEDAERGANATLTIDLAKQEIRGPDGGVVKFEIDPVPQTLPARRARRHRPDHGEETKRLGAASSKKSRAARPWL